MREPRRRNVEGQRPVILQPVEIPGSAQSRLQPLIQAQAGEANVSVPLFSRLFSRLQPGEHHPARIEHAGMFGDTHSGRTLFVRTVVRALARSVAWLISLAVSSGFV